MTLLKTLSSASLWKSLELSRVLFADGETKAPRVRDVPVLSWFIRR